MEYNYKLRYLYFKGGSEETDCIICLNSLTKGETITMSCTHSFHIKCINNWFKKNVNCPFCRTDLKEFALEKGCNECFLLFRKNSDYLNLDCCNTKIHYRCLQKFYASENTNCNNCKTDLITLVQKYCCAYCNTFFEGDTIEITDENGHKTTEFDLDDAYPLPCCKRSVHYSCLPKTNNICQNCNSYLTYFIKNYSCKYCSEYFYYDDNFEINEQFITLPCCNENIHNRCLTKKCTNCGENITDFFIETKKFDIIKKHANQKKIEIDRITEAHNYLFERSKSETQRKELNKSLNDNLHLINLETEHKIKDELYVLINSN
jgi:hypothetical protein